MVLRNPIENLIAHIPLHRYLLPARRRLRHTTPRGELFAKLLRRLLKIQPERLQAGHFGDVFPLIAFNTLDVDFARCTLFCLTGFRGFSFGGFLLRIPLCALLGVDGQSAEVLR